MSAASPSRAGHGWYTRTVGNDLALGIFPVESNLAMCPHCGMQWTIGWAAVDPNSQGPVTIICTPGFGGCGRVFVMLHLSLPPPPPPPPRRPHK